MNVHTYFRTYYPPPRAAAAIPSLAVEATVATDCSVVSAGACPPGDTESLALSGCHSHGASEPLAKLVQ